jgi:SAM-dependent methyltransferase
MSSESERRDASTIKIAREGERWEEMANQDPLWAILSYSEGKYGRWTHERFFASGADRVDAFLTHGSALDRPLRWEAALDFGCGVGRLTRGLAARFEHAVGVDISDTMVRTAQELNATVGNVSFRLNAQPDLAMFSDAMFDFVGTDIVLQHLPDRESVYRYLAEFVRVLRSGGLLVFQLPTSLPIQVRVQPRRTAYRLLRGVGVPARTLYWRLGLHPNRMLAIPGSIVIAFLQSRGAEVLDVVPETSPAPVALAQNVYYVTH